MPPTVEIASGRLTGRDVTERKQLEEQLRHQALHDLRGEGNGLAFVGCIVRVGFEELHPLSSYLGMAAIHRDTISIEVPSRRPSDPSAWKVAR